MVGNRSTLHLSNLHLHDVLQKSTSNQVVVLALKGRVQPFKLHDAVVEVVNVIKNIVTKWGSRSRLQFEYDIVAVSVLPSCINLRSQKDLTSLHIPKVVLLIENFEHFWSEGLLGLVCLQVKHKVIIEIICICCKHLLHVFAHLK